MTKIIDIRNVTFTDILQITREITDETRNNGHIGDNGYRSDSSSVDDTVDRRLRPDNVCRVDHDQ